MKSTKLVLLIILAISLEKFVVNLRTDLFMWIITMSALILAVVVINALDKRRKRHKLEIINLLHDGKPTDTSLMLLLLIQLVGEDIEWDIKEKEQ
jgi:hypothetical protein